MTETPDTITMPSPIGDIRSVPADDGYSLTYRVWTTAEATTTLVLINGIMSHSLWFGPLIESFDSKRFHIVGADRRGSGLNDAGRGDAPSAKTLVSDIARIVRHERRAGGPLVLVGWCWGAVLAIHVTLHLEETVNRLVLTAPGLFPSDEVKARARKIAEESSDIFQSPVEEAMFTQGPYLDGFIRKDARRLTEMTPRFFDLMSRMSIAAKAKLGRLSIPTLVVLAKDDRATDNTQTRETFQALKNVTFATVDGGHGIQFDAPDETARHIVSWIGNE